MKYTNGGLYKYLDVSLKKLPLKKQCQYKCNKMQFVRNPEAFPPIPHD